MGRWIICAGMVFTLAACGAVTPIAGNAAQAQAARTFEQPIDLVRGLAYSTVMDLGFEVTRSDGRGREQSIAASDGERQVDIALEQITEDATRMTVEVRRGLDHDRASARRIVEGVAWQAGVPEHGSTTSQHR